MQGHFTKTLKDALSCVVGCALQLNLPHDIADEAITEALAAITIDTWLARVSRDNGGSAATRKQALKALAGAAVMRSPG